MIPIQFVPPTPVLAQVTNVGLDFSAPIPNTTQDKNSNGTGFTSVQSNTAGNQYDPNLIELNPTAGTLILTATQGSNATANTLKNGLQVEINATQPFTITTRLKGPFTNLTTASQQGGIFLGSSQNNYVKLVIINSSSGVNSLGLQFFQEQNGVRSSVGGSSDPQIRNLDWASIQTLDLYLKGNPATGVITAGYRINSDTAAPTFLTQQFKPNLSFPLFTDSTTARAGILGFTLNAANVPITFDSFGIESAPASTTKAAIENLDIVPFSDRLVFSRIGSLSNPPSNGVHNVATLRVKNTGAEPLQVTALPIVGPWQLANTIPLPATIAAGGQFDIPLKFIANSGDRHNGSLTINYDDPVETITAVQLSGFWQNVSEGGQEPTLNEIVKVYGYATVITNSNQQLNRNGLVQAVGDEVLSPYWQRADNLQPVSVRQLAAYHRQGNTATVYRHYKGSNTTRTIFTHAGIDGQTLLPRKNGSTTSPASGTFSPTGVFGFRIDGEWSDPTKNNQTKDQSNGCVGACGHHVRFWSVKDRQGAVIPNTWLMTMDYSGINYDYQDNVYLVTNIKPETSP